MSCRWQNGVGYLLGAMGLALVLSTLVSAADQPQPGQGGPPVGNRGPQPPGGPPGFGGGFGMPFGGGFGMAVSPSDLLRREDVRKELELVDDQIKQLETLDQKNRERMGQMFFRPGGPGQAGGPGQPGSPPSPPGQGKNRDQGGPRPQGDPRQLFEQMNKETTAAISEILLPHQMTRLNELTVQMKMQGGGMSMLSGDVARDLGITDEQREQLRNKVDEIERETRKKEAELRRQAREQVLGLLSTQQQEKLKSMTGKPFTFEMQMPQRFGPPGGPGAGGSPGAPGGPNRSDGGRPQRPNN